MVEVLFLIKLELNKRMFLSVVNFLNFSYI